MSLQQRLIRRELKIAERNCDWYYGNQDFREQYIHYAMRRRFFLKGLLKIQLKEFNHVKASGKQ